MPQGSGVDDARHVRLVECIPSLCRVVIAERLTECLRAFTATGKHVLIELVVIGENGGVCAR